MLHCVWLCQELQRALEIERSERQSTEARTLQLLSEVREYHNKIANLKDAKSRCVCVCARVCVRVCVLDTGLALLQLLCACLRVCLRVVVVMSWWW